MHVHNVLWSYSHTHTITLSYFLSLWSHSFSVVRFCCVFVVWECVMRSLACRNVYACACICRGLKGMLCIFLYHSLPHSRERGSLTKSKAHLSTRLASKLPGSFCPSPPVPPWWCFRHVKPCSPLYVDSKGANLDHHACIASVLNPLSHLPYFCIFKKQIGFQQMQYS